MANTYTLISSNVLSSSAASVTFSAIPATYTDLVIRASLRTDAAAAQQICSIRLNSDTSTNYSQNAINGSGSSSYANIYSNSVYFLTGHADAATATSNTFSSFEMYVPSYTANQNKPSSIFNVQENNTTAAYMQAYANLYRQTTAISSISFFIDSAGANFVSGSSFYLYGIKSS